MDFSYCGRSYSGCGDGDIYFNGSLVKRIFLNGGQAYQRYKYAERTCQVTCYKPCTESFSLTHSLTATLRAERKETYWDPYGELQDFWYRLCAIMSTSTNGSVSQHVGLVDEYGDEYKEAWSSGSYVSNGHTCCLYRRDVPDDMCYTSYASRSYTFKDGCTARLESYMEGKVHISDGYIYNKFCRGEGLADSTVSRDAGTKTCTRTFNVPVQCSCTYCSWEPA